MDIDYISNILSRIQESNSRALARAISLVENESPGYMDLLSLIRPGPVPLIGITGAPGAGKSTLLNALISAFRKRGKRIGVLAVDPTSPFTHGSLLGDRIRMPSHFNDDQVFIRSLATRGAMGGLSVKAAEISDVMRCAGFDLIFIETVGVGQSEFDIAALAETVLLVLGPESGDQVQVIKSGIMEIADIFVVNKADREGADRLYKSLQELISEKKEDQGTGLVKTIALRSEGIEELISLISSVPALKSRERILFRMAERAYQLISARKMQGINRLELNSAIALAMADPGFNIYRFAAGFSG